MKSDKALLTSFAGFAMSLKGTGMPAMVVREGQAEHGWV